MQRPLPICCSRREVCEPGTLHTIHSGRRNKERTGRREAGSYRACRPATANLPTPQRQAVHPVCAGDPWHALLHGPPAAPRTGKPQSGGPCSLRCFDVLEKDRRRPLEAHETGRPKARGCQPLSAGKRPRPSTLDGLDRQVRVPGSPIRLALRLPQVANLCARASPTPRPPPRALHFIISASQHGSLAVIGRRECPAADQLKPPVPASTTGRPGPWATGHEHASEMLELVPVPDLQIPKRYARQVHH